MEFSANHPHLRGSPWPVFRRTIRNTGSSPICGVYQGDRPWYFQTGKGIFSTPVIDAKGIIYFGSADHNFYAINPDGSEKWRFRTGELIDSAAALPADQPETVLVPSGDGYLYRLNAADGDEIWRFDARISPRASYNNWFEANVTIGLDGTIYAGNTNFNYYAILPDGRLKWTYETGSNAWSAAAFSSDGTIYWGSCDTCFHAVSPEGRGKWKRRTLGFISASAAIGMDGTVFAGSFDSYFYALNPANGKPLWKLKTNDHIYGSAALLENDGQTQAIIFGSTDGVIYAVDPIGNLLWEYDTGAPVRSSPAIGSAPETEGGKIVYAGNGDGILFALNAQSGARRWSYNTTGAGDALEDRNDLNGSPALGPSGIYIGGEHGQLWYVPYDYPIHHPDDPRSCIDPGEPLPYEIRSLYFVSPGGKVQRHSPKEMPAATLFCLKLVVRAGGKTLPARFYNSPISKNSDALKITFDPPIPFRQEVSGDGRYVTIIPEGFLEPKERYKLIVEGTYYLGGFNLGNLTIGGRSSGSFYRRFEFTTESPIGSFPLHITEHDVSTIEWTRLAVPIPSMLPSLNQIGFDYMNWIIAPILVGDPDEENTRKTVLWAIGAQRNEDGALRVDPKTDFRLPLSGKFRDDSFILSNKNFKMAVTGIPIPFNLFQIRGRMGSDLRVKAGARAVAETRVLSIPTFGIPMVIAGLANEIWRKLVAVATYVTRPYPEVGLTYRKPAGIHVSSIDFTPPSWRSDGLIIASIMFEPGSEQKISEHLSAILLVDMDKLEAVNLDYHPNIKQFEDGVGNLARIELTLPKRTHLPENTRLFVIIDSFTIHESVLGA